MCNWYRLADSETAGGNPTQWYTADGVQFLVAYIRCSGPSDVELPRRVAVLDAHATHAYYRAWDTVTSIDPAATIVSRVQAGVADARD